MNDYELVIKRTKTLEALLEEALGASGKGLHEKVSSVQDRLPEPLVRKMRFVATIRNKLVHDSDYEKIDDRTRFLQACDDAEKQLRAMLRPVKKRRFPRWLVLLLLLVIAAIVLVLLRK